MADTNRYGDLLREMFFEIKNQAGDPLFSVTQLDELQRQWNELWVRDNTLKGMLTPEPGTLRVQRIAARETDFLVSPSRSIVFTATTNTSIPNSSYTQIAFSDTRGLINSLATTQYGCAKSVQGYTDRFTKQDWVPAQYPILFFGDFGFATNGTGSREIYIEFFDKDDVSLGGYTFTARPPSANWTNMSFNFMDWFDDGDYCKFWVWQDSGGALDITSANFGFMLG